MIGQEAAAVAAVEDAREAPLVTGQRSHIQQIDHQDVARLDALDMDGAAQHVDDAQLDVLDVGRVVVVLDLSVRPVLALDAEDVARLDRDDGGDIGVPAVVSGDLLLRHRLRQIDLE